MTDRVAESFMRLIRALARNVGHVYALQLWSQFVRERDGYRCVLCSSKKKLSAHHIIRKSFWKHLRFQPGNGITLCSECHKEPHAQFNRRPDLGLPMDAEGGENIELMTGMFGALVQGARQRNIQLSPYYDFDKSAIDGFKRFQGIDVALQFDGAPIEQAYDIWCQTPRTMLEAVMNANGVQLPSSYIQDDMISFLSSADGNNDVMYVRYVPPSPVKPTSNS